MTMRGQIREAIRTAIAWKIVAELFRRHHAASHLRVAEMHPDAQTDYWFMTWTPKTPAEKPLDQPCGGLAVFAPAKDDPYGLLLFQLKNGLPEVNLRPWAHLAPARVHFNEVGWPDGDFAHAFLAARDPREVLDQIEAMVGLPQGAHPPASTPPVLAIRAIASFLERHVLSRHPWRVVGAWSGWNAVQPWVNAFPGLEALSGAAPATWKPKHAARFWGFQHTDAKKPAMLLDLKDATCLLPGERSPTLRLWECYEREGRSLDKVVNLLAAAFS